MDKGTRGRLEKAGWKVGTAQEFLDLSDADMALIELKIAAADALRAKRKELSLWPVATASRVPGTDCSVNSRLIVSQVYVHGEKRSIANITVLSRREIRFRGGSRHVGHDGGGTGLNVSNFCAHAACGVGQENDIRPWRDFRGLDGLGDLDGVGRGHGFVDRGRINRPGRHHARLKDKRPT